MITEPGIKNRQPHVAIFNCAAHGHVNPTISTVKELVARGYRVSYVTSSEFASRIEFAGAKPVIFEPRLTPEKPVSEDLAYIGEEFAKEAFENYPKMMAAFDGDRPDIIAYDILGWHGKALAHHWGIPSVLLSPTHVDYEGMHEEWAGTSVEEQPFVSILEKMLRDNGLKLDIIPFLSKHENIIAYLPRSFQEKSDTTDPSVVFVGPGIGERTPHTGWTPQKGNKPIVLISLGTIFNNQLSFFRTCIKAFADTEWHVVLTIGQHTMPEELGQIPANIEIHRQIPQLEVLQMASLFVTHAGMGSTMEAVHFGVPMIAVPQMVEQLTNAKRIQALGLGKYLAREHVTETSLLSDAREMISNPIYKQNISRLQQEIESAGGARTAADVFDRIAGISG